MAPIAQFQIRSLGKPLRSLALRPNSYCVRELRSTGLEGRVRSGRFIHTATPSGAGSGSSRFFRGFSGVALVLALAGLFSVVSYGVVQRTTEFGIRIALGAPRSHILWLVLKATVIAVGGGLTAGLVFSIALQKLLTRWVAGNAHDLLTIAGVTLLLIVCAVVACLVPGRACRIDRSRASTALRVSRRSKGWHRIPWGSESDRGPDELVDTLLCWYDCSRCCRMHCLSSCRLHIRYLEQPVLTCDNLHSRNCCRKCRNDLGRGRGPP